MNLNKLIDQALMQQGVKEFDATLTPRRIKGRFVTLKYPGKCAACKTPLEVGTKAAWYGQGRVYGLKCHVKKGA